MAKPTILIDFDRTINSYKSGWKGPFSMQDPPNPGAISFLRRVLHTGEYMPVVFTARAARMDDEDRAELQGAIQSYLIRWGLKEDEAERVKVTDKKESHAVLIIDDRAFRFEGEWPSNEELNALCKTE